MDFDPDQTISIPAARVRIEQAVIHHECPFCGSPHWRTPSDDRAFIVQESVLRDGHVSEDSVDWRIVAAVDFVCEGCGFVRVHAATGPVPDVG